MTAQELLTAIRAEIERRKGQAKEHYNEPYSIGRCDAFSEMLNFIYSLEEKLEKPIDGLEEELEKEINKAIKSDLCPEEISDYDFCCIARHFAKWGAEHLKK